MKNPERVSLDDFPGLFVVPTITIPAPDVFGTDALDFPTIPFPEGLGTHEELETEANEEIQKQSKLARQVKHVPYIPYTSDSVWLAYSELHHKYAETNKAKSMYYANVIFQLSYMDDYTLNALSDGTSEQTLHHLLLVAERYPSLFCLRSACLIRAARLCEEKGRLEDARRLYLASLAAVSPKGFYNVYADEAKKRYFAIQDDQSRHTLETANNRFNPATPAQERLLRLLFQKHSDASQTVSCQTPHIFDTAQNAIRFRRAEDQGDKIGRTRFGGLPDVLPGWTWPGNELEFLAQLNLEEIAPYDFNKVLPPRGLLSFFARNLCYGWNDDGKDWLVQFYDGDTSSLQRAEVPEGYDVFGQEIKCGTDLMVFGSASAKPYTAITTNGSHWPQFDDAAHEAQRAFFQAIDKLNNVDLAPPHFPGWNHQILGHSFADTNGKPDFWRFQTPDEEHSISVKEWVLLFQIDSNYDIGMSFSDAGTLYFLIHQHDLAARRFDRIFVTMECG